MEDKTNSEQSGLNEDNDIFLKDDSDSSDIYLEETDEIIESSSIFSEKDSDKDDDLIDSESQVLDNQGEVEEKKDEVVSIQKSKIIFIKKLLNNIKENNEKLIKLFSSFLPETEEFLINIGQTGEEIENLINKETENIENGKIIEGVFDGENMIGPDGKQYNMPANYASKSKLVEGDIMKLTITDKGTFMYKQIGPIERSRIVGKLDRNNEGNFFVVSENGKHYRILSASVTYFKGEIGDEVIILVPKNGESKWAAVENIVKNNQADESL